MRNKPSKLKGILALTITAAMLMTACGSDDDTGASVDTAAPVETAEAPPDTQAAVVEETPEEVSEETPVDTPDAAAVVEGPSTEFDFAKLDKVCEAGADEGSFSYWATIEPDNFARIQKPFKDRYPGIKIDLLSVREEDGAGRILTSIAAN
jgi:ABC-type glycerol-3-phosphate transport system substrate-binding protein